MDFTTLEIKRIMATLNHFQEALAYDLAQPQGILLDDIGRDPSVPCGKMLYDIYQQANTLWLQLNDLLTSLDENDLPSYRALLDEYNEH